MLELTAIKEPDGKEKMEATGLPLQHYVIGRPGDPISGGLYLSKTMPTLPDKILVLLVLDAKED